MKELAHVVEALERLQSDLSRLAGDRDEQAATTIREAWRQLSDVKATLRGLLTGKVTP